MTDHRRYIDFEHTVRVITARARTEVQLAASEATVPRILATFTVTRLAAATSVAADLPVGEIMAKGGQVGATFMRSSGSIEVVLQLKGFATLKAFARKRGRLVAGALEVPLAFDAKGEARCQLPEVPEMIEATRDFEVQVIED